QRITPFFHFFPAEKQNIGRNFNSFQSALQPGYFFHAVSAGNERVPGYDQEIDIRVGPVGLTRTGSEQNNLFWIAFLHDRLNHLLEYRVGYIKDNIHNIDIEIG
ncbi:MAG TPA: hypothetical protein PK360_10840, partial [bacterium]|nr:hypothetical protein [bacterium]